MSTTAGTHLGAFTPLDWLLFLSVGVIWGSSFLLIAIGLDAFAPGLVTWLRIVFGASALWLVPAARQKVHREDFPRLVAVSLLWIAIPFTLFPLAEQHIASGVTGLINGALPIFAVANAGVAWSLGVFEGRGRLMSAITFGLVVGKPVGIVLAAWLAVRTGVAAKPEAYTWRQLCGAGALGGIGFTMSIFISSVAFPDPTNDAAAKIAIFSASLIAGGLGTLVLWRKPEVSDS